MMFLDKTEYQTSLDLSLYIEGLLSTESVEVESKTKTEETIATILLNDLTTQEVEESPDRVKTKTIQSEIVVQKSEEKLINSFVPSWAQKPFKCLSVKLAGMNLMIPAMSVSYIERIDKKIMRLPLEVEAFRGVVTLRERSVAVIDLHKLISENGVSYNKAKKNIEECYIEYVIVMENDSYALMCDEVGDISELSPEEVRWNKASFNNPLFSGIVPDKLCALINIETVQKQIATMPFVQSLNSHY